MSPDPDDPPFPQVASASLPNLIALPGLSQCGSTILQSSGQSLRSRPEQLPILPIPLRHAHSPITPFPQLPSYRPPFSPVHAPLPGPAPDSTLDSRHPTLVTIQSRGILLDLTTPLLLIKLSNLSPSARIKAKLLSRDRLGPGSPSDIISSVTSGLYSLAILVSLCFQHATSGPVPLPCPQSGCVLPSISCRSAKSFQRALL